MEQKQQPGQMDAFSLLMMNAGRKQAAAGAGSKQTKRKPGTSASPAKRARSQDSPQPQSQEQQEQPEMQDASSAQHATAADTRTPAAAVDKQAAVAAFKRAFSAGASSSRKRQQFDNLLVYDFEATTNQTRTLHPIEIIELSCVVVSTATAAITASYQSYVRPTEHPALNSFTSELTGIQQAQVDAAPLLADVLHHHHAWLQQQGVLADGVTCVPVTWTEWDLKVAMCQECGWRRIQRPDYLCRWVDLKQHFRAKYKKAGNLRTCVEKAGLTWQGRAHSGIDDALNTANLAIHLMHQGVVFEVTQVSENPPVVQQSEEQQRQAPQVGSPTSEGSNSKGRVSMAQKAAQRGVSGVFDASGRWLGRCFCGTKAKSRTTKRPGPNHGRDFWSCGCWTITAQQSCEFFLWADDVPAGSLLAKDD